MLKSKNILFFSSDFSLCYSLLMYLQDRYHVTTTTDIDVLKAIVHQGFDLILIDTEPSVEIEKLCEIVHNRFNIPVILTYVFKNQLEEIDATIRKYVSSVFYKPYDLTEVYNKLNSLV